VLGAKVEHLLRLGDAADQRSREQAAPEVEIGEAGWRVVILGHTGSVSVPPRLRRAIKAGVVARGGRVEVRMERIRVTVLHGAACWSEWVRILRGRRPVNLQDERSLAFKANTDRRHHIPKQRFRLTNWAE
jgi:hypothetical protein